DEVLLAQELDEVRQPSTALCAAPVAEAHAALRVVRPMQRRGAARASWRAQRAAALVTLAAVDEREELEHRAGREADALVRVEPEDRAREADIERDLAAVTPVERFGLHRFATTRALHDQPSDLPHSGQKRVRAASAELQCGQVAPAPGAGAPLAAL